MRKQYRAPAPAPAGLCLAAFAASEQHVGLPAGGSTSGFPTPQGLARGPLAIGKVGTPSFSSTQGPPHLLLPPRVHPLQ